MAVALPARRVPPALLGSLQAGDTESRAAAKAGGLHPALLGTALGTEQSPGQDFQIQGKASLRHGGGWKCLGEARSPLVLG